MKVLAVGAIAADSPDVILLDLRPPGMDGLALARMLKADNATHAIPILAATAFPERYVLNALLAAGCDCCIPKPIDTRALAKTVEEIGHKRMAT